VNRKTVNDALLSSSRKLATASTLLIAAPAIAASLASCGGEDSHSASTHVVRAPTGAAGASITSSDCGSWRRSVKQAFDSRIGEVDSTAVSTTVTGLSGLTTGKVTDADSDLPRQRGTAEERTWLLGTNAEVRPLYSRREADSDIHFVIQAVASGRTMIVEFVAYDCATSSPYSSAIQRARFALYDYLNRCSNGTATVAGETWSKYPSGARVTIRGIGFFDFVHNQVGVAPNGIELHPVLAFSGTC
jgi:hypothetical protein